MKKFFIAGFALIILLSLSICVTANTNNAQRIKLKDGTSSNWAGYAIQTNLANPQNNAVSDVKGTWVIPTVDCSSTPTGYASIWVGIDGYSSNTVEQTGTDSDCSSGSARYYAWYEMYPKFSILISSLQVSAGDTMQAEVKYNGNGHFLLTITDQTKGTSFSTVQMSKKARRSSAEWIVEAPSSGGVLPLSNFGTASLSNSQATVNGITGSINNGAWQYDKIDMASNSGALKAQTSSLSPDGKSFSVDWKSS